MTTQAFGHARPLVVVRGRPGGLPLGAIFGALAAMGAAVVGLVHLDRLPFTVCYFKALTGWACLSCGATRALGRLFELDLAGALAMNPLATMGILSLVPWAAADLALLPSGRALSVELAPAAARAARLAFALALAANWVYLLAVGR